MKWLLLFSVFLFFPLVVGQGDAFGFGDSVSVTVTKFVNASNNSVINDSVVNTTIPVDYLLHLKEGLKVFDSVSVEFTSFEVRENVPVSVPETPVVEEVVEEDSEWVKTLFVILGWIVGIVVVIGVFIWLFMMYQNKSVEQDFYDADDLEWLES